MRAWLWLPIALAAALPAAAQSFVDWQARARRFDVEAGDRSAFELSDDRLIELALAEYRRADLRISDSTVERWRRIVERCRSEGQAAVTLSAFWLEYRYTAGHVGFDRMAFAVDGGSVVLLPAGAPEWLADHEAGHARLLEGSFDLGERVARAAFRRYDGREAPRGDEMALRASAEAMIGVLDSMENALDLAYDRVSVHRESGAIPEDLLGGAVRRIDAAARRTSEPAAIAADVVGGLDRLGAASDLVRWSAGR